MKRKKIITIIAIIAMCLFVTGCNKKEETIKKEKENIKKEKVETLITEDMNQKIDRFIDAFQLKYTSITNEELEENEKLYYAFYFASNKWTVDYVEREAVEKTMLELFGSNIKYDDKDIKSLFTDETMVYYRDGRYVYNHNTAHGVTAVKGYSYETSRTRNNSIIKVELKRIYNNCRGDTCPVSEIFKDPEYKEKIEVPEKYCYYDQSMPDFCIVQMEDYVKENLDSLPTLTFEFNLENNNPVFNRVYR